MDREIKILLNFLWLYKIQYALELDMTNIDNGKIFKFHKIVYGIGEIKNYRNFWKMKTKISPL